MELREWLQEVMTLLGDIEGDDGSVKGLSSLSGLAAVAWSKVSTSQSTTVPF